MSKGQKKGGQNPPPTGVKPKPPQVYFEKKVDPSEPTITNLGKSPSKKYDADTILHKNIMKLDDDILKKFRIKHNLSGVIIIAYEDLEKEPNQMRLLYSCKFKASSGIIGRFMHNIMRKKRELM